MRRLLSALRDRAAAFLPDANGMSRSDRARWASAKTMADLGELVIAWLHGEITQTPGHCGPPCEETYPLVPYLEVLNRAGFVTDNSQLAESVGGRTWNTDVDGFASDEVLARIREACEGTGLIVAACRGCVHECGRHLKWWFCPWKEQADFWAERCPQVADELYGSWFVHVEDPVPGRNDLLWPVLEKVLSPDGGTS